MNEHVRNIEKVTDAEVKGTNLWSLSKYKAKLIKAL